jgi:D-alanine--poly(phosphoribitol) ligase subunit 1
VDDHNLGLAFEGVAELRAGQSAIWFDENVIVSYGELNRLANRVARWLLSSGVSAGDLVCLSGEKSLDSFAAMIACLKVGAVYSVLDPDSPAERLRKIVSTCKPSLLLGARDFLEMFDEVAASLGVVAVEKDSDTFERTTVPYDDANLNETRAVAGTDSAYVMFTSGSTGFPKGAVMTHTNVLNLIEWSRATFGIEVDDRLTNVNPLFFDNSVFDFYASLFNVACLVPFSKDEVRDPKLLVERVAAAGCTLWFSVPSLLIFLQTMKAADGETLRSIRRFVFGGEGYPKAKLKHLYEAYSGSSELFNVYGPTECTCICSSYKITEGDFEDLRGLPPLGKIAANFSFLILDEDGRMTPAGETGELCLLGPNVGKGYYNDPDRTAASFVPNPHNDAVDEIMYKTGDLVRFDPDDGNLYIQGRKDNQIKHMGYRIELEEIEAAIHRLDYVVEAVALHGSVNGLSRIVAVVTPSQEFEDERIRQDLGSIIPGYMIPSAFYREDALPKNPSGKIDRRLLSEKYLQPETVMGDLG